MSRHARFDCSRVGVAFDSCDGVTIKPGARQKRPGLARRPIRRRIIDDADVPPSTNWKQFIDLSGKKADLVKFMSEQILQNADALKVEIFKDVVLLKWKGQRRQTNEIFHI